MSLCRQLGLGLMSGLIGAASCALEPEMTLKEFRQEITRRGYNRCEIDSECVLMVVDRGEVCDFVWSSNSDFEDEVCELADSRTDLLCPWRAWSEQRYTLCFEGNTPVCNDSGRCSTVYVDPFPPPTGGGAQTPGNRRPGLPAEYLGWPDEQSSP